MTTTILTRARDDRVHLIEETLARNGSLPVVEVKDLVQLALTLPGDLRAIWASIKLRLQQDAISGHLDELGGRLKDEFNAAIVVMRNVLAAANAQGVAADELARAVAELEERRDRILKNWPWSDRPLPQPDAESLGRAREEMERGEGEDLADIVARLRRGEPL